MAAVLVVADDLTGANATAARFARLGMRAVTVSDPTAVGGYTDRYDAVVVNADSRCASGDVAAARARTAIRAAGPVPLVVKRVDTTLRGNLGAETGQALATLSGQDPHRRVRALIQPAFPASGRVTVDGLQLLDGAPLERTELARDPQWPLHTSSVAELFDAQTQLPVRHVGLPRIVAGGAELDAALGGDEPLVVCDALDEAHLASVADAAARRAQRDQTRWISVDPGPGGAELARALGLTAPAAPRPPLLVVAGSATELTRRQLGLVERETGCELLDVAAEQLGDPDADTGLAERLAAAISAAPAGGVTGLRTVGADGRLLDDPELTRRLPARLAAVVARAMRRAPVAGVYTTGGDVTTHLLGELGIGGLEVDDEAVPLAVLGTAVGGPWDGLPLATKGGLVGDERAAWLCLDRLRRLAETRRARTPDTPDTSNTEGTKGYPVNDSRLPVLAVTLGDPAGIGPEIVARTLAEPETAARAHGVAVGDASVLRRAVAVCGLDARVREVSGFGSGPPEPGVIDVLDIDVAGETAPPWGQVGKLAGQAAVTAVEVATRAALERRVDGLVTAPINKEAIWAAGSQHLGHTEMLGELTGSSRYDTMFVVRASDGAHLKIFFTTRHTALRKALDRVDRETVRHAVDEALTALWVFGHDHPRLAVAALNPHGGENGNFGDEEIVHIGPACESARAAGHDVAGPIPADSVFHQGLQGRYDGVLSHFHDQGHIPAKTYDFDGTVSITVGLPILRTSVDHGTAFDIAGTGTASAATMRSAFLAGADFARFTDRISAEYGTS